MEYNLQPLYCIDFLPDCEKILGKKKPSLIENKINKCKSKEHAKLLFVFFSKILLIVFGTYFFAAKFKLRMVLK